MKAVAKKALSVALLGLLSASAFADDASFVSISGVVGQVQTGTHNYQLMDVGSANSSLFSENYSTVTAGNILQFQGGAHNTQDMVIGRASAVPGEMAVAEVHITGTVFQAQGGTHNEQHMRIGNVD